MHYHFYVDFSIWHTFESQPKPFPVLWMRGTMWPNLRPFCGGLRHPVVVRSSETVWLCSNSGFLLLSYLKMATKTSENNKISKVESSYPPWSSALESHNSIHFSGDVQMSLKHQQLLHENNFLCGYTSSLQLLVLIWICVPLLHPHYTINSRGNGLLEWIYQKFYHLRLQTCILSTFTVLEVDGSNK